MIRSDLSTKRARMAVSSLVSTNDYGMSNATASRRASYPRRRAAPSLVVLTLLVSMLPGGTAAADSIPYYFQCGKHTISGFEHYGNPSASTRDNNTSSAEQCSHLQARVRTNTGVVTTGGVEADNYTRHTHYANLDWSYAWGRAYGNTYWSEWAGLAR